MPMISNINDQVQKSINEVERNYSKGMEFQLGGWIPWEQHKVQLILALSWLIISLQVN